MTITTNYRVVKPTVKDDDTNTFDFYADDEADNRVTLSEYEYDTIDYVQHGVRYRTTVARLDLEGPSCQVADFMDRTNDVYLDDPTSSVTFARKGDPIVAADGFYKPSATATPVYGDTPGWTVHGTSVTCHYCNETFAYGDYRSNHDNYRGFVTEMLVHGAEHSATDRLSVHVTTEFSGYVTTASGKKVQRPTVQRTWVATK